MKRTICIPIALILIGRTIGLMGQSEGSTTNGNQETTLRVNSRAVLVDVLVTDKKGAPVRGLAQNAFTVKEQGKPQTVTFFEEHQSAESTGIESLTLPPNVFSNHPGEPQPAAVTVLLLDALNASVEDQAFVHQQALRFLRTAKPGSRMAIFTMSSGLHYVQGFTDDPALLVAALNAKKGNGVEQSSLLTSGSISNAEQGAVNMMSQSTPTSPTPGGSSPPTTAASPSMIAGLESFLHETAASEESDREYRTLTNLQQLATFLGAFPGRKNLIWFSTSFPAEVFAKTEPRFEGDVKKTVNLLTAARVALYPVDARGVGEHSFYTAGDRQAVGANLPREMSGASDLGAGPGNLSPNSPGAGGNPLTASALGGPDTGNTKNEHPLAVENEQTNSKHSTMDILAHDSGGRAFYNTNGLANVISEIGKAGADFYTLSYVPEKAKMDGGFRNVSVEIEGQKYNLSYRRGYYAADADRPGAAEATATASQGGKQANPLAPFMALGMPESEQIGYRVAIKPSVDAAADAKTVSYDAVFTVTVDDLSLKVDGDGIRTGALIVGLTVYDRYGQVVNQQARRAAVTLKPEVYAAVKTAGLGMSAKFEAPAGQYWLRTGVYDEGGAKVGTVEIPLAAVKPVVAQGGN
ncbi:MAG TPA: VWA domain-containing protein [Terracidiphilus sp.]|nr:VWA domain-containing protein [Terracidiphilus sp.]